MGSCATQCCSIDDTQQVILKLKKTEHETQSPPRIVAPEQIEKIVFLQAFTRGYLVRKTLSTQLRHSRSSGNKQSQLSEMINDTKKQSKYRSLLVQAGPKVNHVTYLSNEQVKRGSDNQSDSLREVVSGDSPKNRRTSTSNQLKYESKAVVPEIFEVNSQGSQTHKSKRVKIRKSMEIPSSGLNINVIEAQFNSDDEEEAEQDSSQIKSSNRMQMNIQAICFEPEDVEVLNLINSREQITLGPIQMLNGGVYEGSWQNGKANGNGKYIFPDRSIINVLWIDGMANGPGMFTHPDGDHFEGTWRDNVAHGYGSYRYPTGAVYQGNWKRDQPHGLGRETYPDGTEYKGPFKLGIKCGKGELRFPDGSNYVGEFRENEMDGQGIYLWADGRQYQGEWVASKMHGKGCMTWPDGRRYEGQYIHDQKCGFGIFSWKDGRKYIGQWQDGLQDGTGEFHSSEGAIRQGRWVKGKLQK